MKSGRKTVSQLAKNCKPKKAPKKERAASAGEPSSFISTFGGKDRYSRVGLHSLLQEMA